MGIPRMRDLADLRQRIQQRIDYYEALPECSGAARLEFESREQMIDAVELAIVYAWPYSAYAILKGLQWTALHPEPPPGDAWWSEVDLLLWMMTVRHEYSAATYERDVQAHGGEYAERRRQEAAHLYREWELVVLRWPHAEHALILEWLLTVQDWPWVREADEREVREASAYWSERVRRADGEAATRG